MKVLARVLEIKQGKVQLYCVGITGKPVRGRREMALGRIPDSERVAPGDVLQLSVIVGAGRCEIKVENVTRYVTASWFKALPSILKGDPNYDRFNNIG